VPPVLTVPEDFKPTGHPVGFSFDEQRAQIGSRPPDRRQCPMISGVQVRAARALLGWTARDLSRRSVVSVSETRGRTHRKAAGESRQRIHARF
jgi:hypothetical protein